MSKQFLTIAAALLAARSFASAQTVLHVPATYPTIQAALNAASPGDAVHVAAGTYTGPGNRDLDPQGKDVLILGLGGLAGTIIDCQGSAATPHRGFFVGAGGPGLVIDGFTVRNGFEAGGGGIRIDGADCVVRNVRVENCSCLGDGGGVYVGPGFSAFGIPTFENCAFASNTAPSLGGGAFVIGNVIPGAIGAAFTNCTFDANQAVTRGGGLCALWFVALTLDGCTFTGNAATAPWGFGGGMSIEYGTTLAAQNCSFTNNTANNGGGAGIFANATALLTGCNFSNNVATDGGGGLALDGWQGTPPATTTMAQCVFQQNSAQNGGGASVLGPAADVTATDCDFLQNHAAANGWGGALRAGFESSVALQGCDVVGNDAWRGGGVLVNEGAALSAVGGTWSGNVAVEVGGGAWIGGSAPPGGANSLALNGVVVAGNIASGGGGVAAFDSATAVSVVGGTFTANQATGFGWAGGLYFGFGAVGTLHGTVVSGGSAFRGGGMTVEQGAQVALDVATFSSNTATQLGGAIYMNHGGNPVPAALTATGTILTGNSADEGGAIMLDGPVTASFASSTFDANHASFEGGAAKAAWGGAATFTATALTNNTATASGGAISVVVGGRAVLADCDVANNQSANGSGGGLYAWQAPVADVALSVRNCRIRGNSAPNNNGGGMALINGATADCAGVFFTGNTAGDAAGAFVVDPGSAATLALCTFAGNASAGLAHNLRLIHANAILSNCIARSTSPLHLEALGTATLSATFCDIEGGYAGAGNFDADPQFVDAPNGDYRLGATSPCRDAGSLALLPSGYVVDFDGTPRPTGSGVDVGADEIAPNLPGTGEDFVLTTTVDGAGAALTAKVADAGSLLVVRFESPNGTFVGGVPLLVANLFPAAAPPPPSFIPGVQVDLASVLILLDGSAPFPFGTLALPPGGFALGYTAPPFLAGFTLRLQAAVVAPMQAANGIFATTDAHEIRFV